MIYFPQIKTTAAELRAFRNLKNLNEPNLIPILQITKPRVGKNPDPISALDRHLVRVFESFPPDQKIIVNVTEDETYQDSTLNQFIHDYSDGYILWIEQVRKLKSELCKNIVPCIIGTASNETFNDLKLQIQRLQNEFDEIAIRLPINIPSNINKLLPLLELLGLARPEKKLYLLLDFGYLDVLQEIDLKTAIDDIDQLITSLDSNNIIPITLFSSCPSSFKIIDRINGKIEKQAILEYNILKYIKLKNKIQYGDYAYIHPKRSGGGGFWMPRIDYPMADNICHYLRYFNRKTSRFNGKLKIETTLPNDKAYISLSQTLTDSNIFQNDTLSSWGRDQLLENVTAEEVTGKSPAYYIAIRSNIHMERILSSL